MKEYYKSTLSGDEKKVYNDILAGISEYKEKIKLTVDVDTKSFEKCVVAVQCDNPEIFYVLFSSVRLAKSSEGFFFMPHYIYGRDKAEKIKMKIDEKINRIKKLLSKHNISRDYDKYATLHDYFVNNCEYNTDALVNPEPLEAMPFSFTIEGVLLREKAVCMGFSLAYKYLCDILGLKAIVVKGKSRKPDSNINMNHAWNIVSYTGVYVHIDITWDICSMLHRKLISYDYFLLCDGDMKRDHEYSNYPACPNRHLSYFEKWCIDYTSLDELEIYLKKLYFEYKNIYFLYFRFRNISTVKSEVIKIINKITAEELKRPYTANYSINESQSCFKMVLKVS